MHLYNNNIVADTPWFPRGLLATHWSLLLSVQLLPNIINDNFNKKPYQIRHKCYHI